MTTIEGQTVRRRRLRSELRRVRETASLTQDQVATAMDWSLSKVIRIENGAVGISTNDLKALLDLYGVTERRRVDDLVGLAQSARQRARAWWSAYRSVISPQYLTYLGYEAEASAIRQFHAAVVPALSQTEADMRAILRDTPLTPMKPDVVSLDGGPNAVFLHESADEVTKYRDIFSRLRESSLSPRDSADLIRQIAATM